MKTPEAGFLVWQRNFHNEDNCVEHLKNIKLKIASFFYR